jgi:hypothetical protein
MFHRLKNVVFRKKTIATVGVVLLVLVAPVTGLVLSATRPTDPKTTIDKAMVDFLQREPTAAKTVMTAETAQGTVTAEILQAGQDNAYQFDIKVTMDTGFIAFSLNFKAMYDRVNSHLYVQVDNADLVAQMLASNALIPPSAVETVSGKLKGAWLKLTLDDLSSSTDGKHIAQCAAAYMTASLQPHDSQPLSEILSQHKYINVDRILEDETAAGRPSHHYAISFDQADLNAVYQAAGRLDSFKPIVDPCQKAFASLENLGAETPSDTPTPFVDESNELWIDKHTGQLTKMLQSASADGNTITLSQEYVHHKPYNVVLPSTRIISLKELLDAAMRAEALYNDDIYVDDYYNDPMLLY